MEDLIDLKDSSFNASNNGISLSHVIDIFMYVAIGIYV